jgi:hypothetical protein
MPDISRMAVLVIAALAACAARAQDTRDTAVLPPAQSAAKAKEVIRETIQALGGPAYLGLKDATCNGRLAQIGHNGEITGYVRFVDYRKLPDRDRTEFYYKTYINVILATVHKTNMTISVWNGDQAWAFNGAGVEELPADFVDKKKDDLRKDINNLFRNRMNDPDLNFRYGGLDMVDLKQVDWVEVADSGLYTTRIAIDHATHLPLRSILGYRNPATRERDEEVAIYSIYHSIQGVMTPFQVSRSRNGLAQFQMFVEDCKFNTGLNDSLFTRESLEQRAGQSNKGKKAKKDN